MAPIDLSLLRSFIAVYETGSFSAAARRLAVPRSTVSRAIASLEESLKEKFFHRDTRNVVITPEGRHLYERVSPAFASLELALRERSTQEEGATGTLRITATPDLATMVMAEAVTRFTQRYPKTTVDLHLTYKMVDLVREGFDVGIRLIGRSTRRAALVSRKIGSLTVGLYASPSFVASHDNPCTPEEVKRLAWVTFLGAPLLKLETASTRTTLPAQARINCDDMFFAREVLRMGAGVGPLPAFVAADDLTRGTLVRVLPRVAVATGAIHLVYPDRRLVPTRVTAFRDVMLEMLQQRPLAV